MEISNFIQNFSELFEDTDTSVFNVETRFKDIDEWSSIIALSVIAMIDEEYEVIINGDDIRKANTISELFNTVASKKK